MLNVPSFILKVEKNVRPHTTRTPFGRIQIPRPLFLISVYLFVWNILLTNLN